MRGYIIACGTLAPTASHTWNSFGAEAFSIVTNREACSTEMPSTVISRGSCIVTRPSLPDMAQQAPRLLSCDITDSTGPMLHFVRVCIVPEADEAVRVFGGGRGVVADRAGGTVDRSRGGGR